MKAPMAGRHGRPDRRADHVEYAARLDARGLFCGRRQRLTALWSYANGSWTELPIPSGHACDSSGIAIDPSNPSEIVIETQSGCIECQLQWRRDLERLVISKCASLHGYSLAGAGPRARWRQSTAGMTVGGMAFNPLIANQLITSGGTGVWYASVPTSGRLRGQRRISERQSVGIENLVANEIIVPPGGNPVLASWDRPFFYITNPNAYPSTYGPVSSDGIVAGWSVDYASSTPSFIVGIADW